MNVHSYGDDGRRISDDTMPSEPVEDTD